MKRIAEALERLAPPKVAAADFASARLFRHDPAAGAFVPAGDFALPLDMLVGVERQKLRFCENLSRFAAGLPANHALLWGVRGTGKSSLAKAAFMEVAAGHATLKLVEIDRDEVAALPALFDQLRGRSERFMVLCDDLSFEEGAAAAKAPPRTSRWRSVKCAKLNFGISTASAKGINNSPIAARPESEMPAAAALFKNLRLFM